MRLHLNTTIQSLYSIGRISTRTFNCMCFAGMATMKDVLAYIGDNPETLLKLKNFGRKSYTEILPLLDEVSQEELDNPTTITAEDMFSLLDARIASILSETYASIFKVDNKVTACFKLAYPTVAALHCEVIGNIGSLLKIHDQLSMQENVEFRRMADKYMFASIFKMQDISYTDTSTYAKYRYNEMYLSDKLDYFTYEERMKHFMSATAKELLHAVDKEMRTKLSVRTRNFLDTTAPTFEALVPYFAAPLKSYGQLCPGKYMKHTLTEVFSFNQQLKAAFDQYWQMGDKEASMAILEHEFPFLTEDERAFVSEHKESYGFYPQFYLLYSYMRQSEQRNDQIYSLLYGISDSKERTLTEIAEIMGMTRERIRQIVSGPLEVHYTSLIKNEGWTAYEELLSLPYVTAESAEYKRIREREHLDIDFRSFARLIQLLGCRDSRMKVRPDEGSPEIVNSGCQYETEIVGNVAIVINRCKMPSFKMRYCYDTLEKNVSARHTATIRVDAGTMLNDMGNTEAEYAVKLMCIVASEVFELETNDIGQIQIPKNSIDVAVELYHILAQKGEPMSIEELFEAFKEMYPDHKYTKPAQLRPSLLKHPQINAIGHTSRYGLATWSNVYYGTIRDLLIQQLEASETPLHIEELFNAVIGYYPNTTIYSLTMSMRVDELGRFVLFKDDLFGLKGKKYDESFLQRTIQQRFSFDERLADFCQFVVRHNHYPLSNTNDENEASLYRWLYNIRKNAHGVRKDDKERLAKAFARFEAQFIPRNGRENRFLDNCQKYKAYIESHQSLPTHHTEPRLYYWMKQSKACYNRFADHRRKYMIDLLNYIALKGGE